MPDGTGDEIGPAVEASLQAFFKSNWSLSKYQVTRQDLETEVRVVYDSEGNLIKKAITRSSGDKVFDQSVEDAVLKSKKLPFPLPNKLDSKVIFNLRDLQQ
jgi:TonB family protein